VRVPKNLSEVRDNQHYPPRSLDEVARMMVLALCVHHHNNTTHLQDINIKRSVASEPMNSSPFRRATPIAEHTRARIFGDEISHQGRGAEQIRAEALECARFRVDAKMKAFEEARQGAEARLREEMRWRATDNAYHAAMPSAAVGGDHNDSNNARLPAADNFAVDEHKKYVAHLTAQMRNWANDPSRTGVDLGSLGGYRRHER